MELDLNSEAAWVRTTDFNNVYGHLEHVLGIGICWLKVFEWKHIYSGLRGFGRRGGFSYIAILWGCGWWNHIYFVMHRLVRTNF